MKGFNHFIPPKKKSGSIISTTILKSKRIPSHIDFIKSDRIRGEEGSLKAMKKATLIRTSSSVSDIENAKINRKSFGSFKNMCKILFIV